MRMTPAQAHASHEAKVAAIIAAQPKVAPAAPAVRTYDDEQWMDDSAVALNAGRFEADGFIPRNVAPAF